MTTKNKMATNTGKEFVITREYNAPRELVFQAFTQAESLAQWWGPKGFKIVVSKLEFRPGGVFHYCMQGENGFEMWGKFVYQEIIAPEKIVFLNSFSDKEGNIIPPPFPDPWPVIIANSIILTEQNGKTLLTLRAKAHHATDEEIKTFEDGFSSMQEGYGGTFDQLENYLSETIKK